jgi:hypothetical protein
VDGKHFFGVNSDSDAYTPGDWAAAKDLRTLLTEIYPELKSRLTWDRSRPTLFSTLKQQSC